MSPSAGSARIPGSSSVGLAIASFTASRRQAMALNSILVTTLGAVSVILVLSAFVTGGTFYNYIARHEQGIPEMFDSKASEVSPSYSTLSRLPSLRGRYAVDKMAGSGSAPRRQPAKTENTSQVRRFLAFIPLLGLKNDDWGSRESERLVLEAWNALANHVRLMNESVELRVVGMVEDASYCDPRLFGPSASLASSAVSCLTLGPSCNQSGQKSAPTLDCIFEVATRVGDAYGANVYILANGDVVFTPTFTEAIAFALNTFGNGSPVREGEEGVAPSPRLTLQPPASASGASGFPPPCAEASQHEGFVLVGRRLDMNVSIPKGPDDPPLTAEDLLAKDVNVRLHPPTGIDYFAFTANLLPRSFPPFLIGRWRWDNTLLLHFLLSKGASIDATEVVHALHIGMAPFDSAEHATRAGAHYNDVLAASTAGSAHKLGRSDFTTYVLKDGGMPEEEDEVAPHHLALRLERRSHPLIHGQLAGLRVAERGFAFPNASHEERNAHVQADENSGKTIFLLPVPAGEVASAMEWACWAGDMGLPNYLFVAASRNDSCAIEAALAVINKGRKGGEVLHMDPSQLTIAGWGGSKPYFNQKKSGIASRAVLDYGTGALMQRLLRLGLSVVLVPTLTPFPPPSRSASSASPHPHLPSFWGKNADAKMKGDEGTGRTSQEVIQSVMQASDDAACDVILWEETHTSAPGHTDTLSKHTYTKESSSKEKADKRANFLYARVEASSQIMKNWDTVFNCLTEDVRSSKSKRGWCFAELKTSCHHLVPAVSVSNYFENLSADQRLWSASSLQCRQKYKNRGT